MKTLRTVLLALPATLFAACGEPVKSSPSPAVGKQEAKALYESLCYTCHGTQGRGDGPGAVACDPKPRTFSDADWQDSVTDDQIKKTIVYGGAAVGKSAQMPAQPQLKGKTAVLDAMVEIVRGFRAK